MSILATDYVTLSYQGKIINFNPSWILHIPRDDADTIAQQNVTLSELMLQYGSSMVNRNNFVFDDRSDITEADVIPFEECPSDLTFSFVQEPAIYPKS